MEKNRIAKKKISSFLDILSKHYSRIIGPGLDEKNVPQFKIVNSIQELDLKRVTPLKPPKEFFFPQTEEMMTFTKDGHYKSSQKGAQKQVLFGLRSCDVKGVELSRKFFTDHFQDPYVYQVLENTLVIGISCEYPSSGCFCTTMGISPVRSDGSDIYLTDVGDFYLVEWISEKGQAIKNLFDSILEEATSQDDSAKKMIEEKTMGKLMDATSLTEIKGKVKDVYTKEDLWKHYSDSCINCGGCTFDCPTCTCFDVMEKMVSPKEGQRARTWDSCQFFDFCLHASGHNPRGSKMNRLRQRIMHKYEYTVSQFDQWSCTGCGRCIRVCPVGINTKSILKDIKEELHG